jgi:hypothetical protein
MTPSTPDVSSYPDTRYPGKGLVIKHRVRMEVEPKESGGKVNVARIFMDLVKAIETAADDNVKFYDVKDKAFSVGTAPSMTTFTTDFLVTPTDGAVRKVILGFYLESVIPFSTIKSRIGTTWFNRRKIFLRIHPMDFKWGVELHLLGYLTNEHPYTANMMEVADTVNQHLDHAWVKYREDSNTSTDKLDKILALKDYFANGNVSIPLGIVRTTEKFVPPAGGDTIDVDVFQLYVPKRNNWMVKLLVDRALLVDKQFPDFVPFALKKENPKLFARWMIKQVDFLDQHRNIQLRDVSELIYMEDGSDSQPSLEVLLETNSNIHRIYTDFDNDRIHLSTTAAKYSAVCKWIDQELAKYEFSVQRFSRSPRLPSHSTNLPPGSKTGKYSAAFSLPDNDASLGVSTIMSHRTNPWKRRPPMELVCDLTTAAFPPLVPDAKAAPGDTATTQVSTLGESDIQHRIDEAIQRAQAKMDSQMQSLQKQIDVQLQSYQSQLDTAINNIVSKTLEALTGTSSPFVTKADYTQMESQFAELSATTTAIWDLLKSKESSAHKPPASSPTRLAKRPNMNSTPIRGDATPHHRPRSPEPMDEEGGQT